MAFLDKAKNWVSKNPDKAGHAIDKAGAFFDQKTKGKYRDKVNKAQGAAHTYVNKNNRGGPGQYPNAGPQNPPLHP